MIKLRSLEKSDEINIKIWIVVTTSKEDFKIMYFKMMYSKEHHQQIWAYVQHIKL